ncbi:MAG: hypothetical protein U0325_05035 [Polyangiales bacterium]
MRARLFSLSVLLFATSANAQLRDDVRDARVPIHDPTGGAYTPVTPLFTPAAALPALNVRARAGAEVQPASGGYAALRPVLDLELGLPAGFTLAAGTTWVGGTSLARGEGEGLAGLGAYGQLRWQFLGRGRDEGVLGGVSVSVKANGYRGGEPEIEGSLSLQYRARRFEVGLQGTYGRGLGDEDENDVEARLYLAYRPIPSFALGVSGQLRMGIEDEEREAEREALCRANPSSASCLGDLDALAGVTASYTYERWHLGVLVGGSSIGLARLDDFRVGFYTQASGSVRF